MNFKKLKKLITLVIISMMLISENQSVLAGNTLTAVKNESYRVKYDASRIIKGYFNYSKHSVQFGKSVTLYGPWRIMAFTKARHNPRFKNFLTEWEDYQLGLHNLFKEISQITGLNNEPSHVLDKNSDLNFHFNYSWITEDESFEELVEECRKEWNLMHNYGNPIRTPEEAFEKALRILEPAFKGEDPFSNELVAISYDLEKKVYLVENEKNAFHGGKRRAVNSILLSEDGEVLSIDCKEEYLQDLV